MSSTERVRDQSQLAAARADIQRLAALPDWLVRAAQPDRVANLLTHSIPECAAGTITLHDCKISGLRLNAATHAWTGSYTLTVTSATTQQQRIALQGMLFPPQQPAPQRSRADSPFGSTGWRCYLPELRLELAVPTAPAPALQAELNRYLHTTAVGLVALHRTPVPDGAAYGWADELAEVRQFVDNLTAAVPELMGAATALLAVLEVYAAATPSDPPVFAHGTFRPNHVLLHQGQVGLIDFDSWCQAESALDLALFLTSIKDIGLSAVWKASPHTPGAALSTSTRARAPGALGGDLRELFGALYRVALWEALDLFTLVLRSWDRVKPVRLANMLRLLDRHIRRHLG